MDERRSKVYDYIVWHKQAYDGIPPSVRSIMGAVGLRSTSAVFYHLNKLEEAGLITRTHYGYIMVSGAKWIPPQASENMDA